MTTHQSTWDVIRKIEAGRGISPLPEEALQHTDLTAQDYLSALLVGVTEEVTLGKEQEEYV